MKKWTKIVLGIGIGASLAGAGLAGIGLATGGLTKLNQKYEVKSHIKQSKVTLDQFNKIDINASTFDVVVSKVDIDKPFISYSDTKKLPVSYQVTSDGTLTVKQTGGWNGNHRSSINLFSLADLVNLTKTGTVTNKHTIIISIPKNMDIHSIKTNLKTGDLQFSDVTADYANIELSAGVLDITNCNFNSGKLTIAVGEGNFQNCNLNKFSLTTSTGDIDFENGKIIDSNIDISLGDFSANGINLEGLNTLSSSTGDVDITLANKELTVQASNNIGDSDISSSLIPSTKNILKVDGNTGDITIN
ncbi:DUF4097 family beta strand repeat protein [Streptococcus sp. SL1232]|uniref:DUF4097 domain-containing protein n=1 Tax=Streptococcus vicugnae TaxID=2740579 RepID=A0A4R5G609_9STRE|nr:DUF4097 family beta strand repeat-containing protein [Streptococcus vicugnae]MBJ7541718.1 DUF4097 family beta strand repeat protein [Streptococcus vicugnae]TDE72967.1 hypothetical protein E0E04_04870 [Streptococcus vicugnae]